MDTTRPEQLRKQLEASVEQADRLGGLVAAVAFEPSGAAEAASVVLVDGEGERLRHVAVGASHAGIDDARGARRVLRAQPAELGEQVGVLVQLELPAVEGRRDRIVSPADAAALVAALAEDDQPLWATAFYGGLRRGELGGLRWRDVDLAAGVIRVERAWDFKCRVFVEPKSRAGRRAVPIPAVLRGHLAPHKLRSGRRDDELVFGRTGSAPFDASLVADRAKGAWERMNAERDEEGIEPLVTLTLHEARHTFASLMIAAGVNAKALSTYMGHASIAITYDLYGKLLPGNEAEAAERMDAYLDAQAEGGQR